jgi:hypothetical protein
MAALLFGDVGRAVWRRRLEVCDRRAMQGGVFWPAFNSLSWAYIPDKGGYLSFGYVPGPGRLDLGHLDSALRQPMLRNDNRRLAGRLA